MEAFPFPPGKGQAKAGSSSSRWLFAAMQVVILALLGALFWSGYLAARREASATVDNLADMLTANMEVALDRAESDVRSFAQQMTPDDMDGRISEGRMSDVETRLGYHLQTFPVALHYRIFDQNGQSLFAAGTGNARMVINVADRDWFRQLREDSGRELVLSEVVTGKSTGGQTLILAVPVRDAQRRFRGAAVAALNLGYFSQMVNGLTIGPQGLVAVRRSDNGRLVMRRPERPQDINQAVDAHDMSALMPVGKASPEGDFVSTLDHVRRLYAVRLLQRYPLSVTVATAEGDYLASWRHHVLWTSVGAAGLLLLLGWLHRRKAAAQKRLGEEGRRYQALLRTATDGIHVLDDQGRLVEASDSFYRMLGRRPNEREQLSLLDWHADLNGADPTARLQSVIDGDGEIFEARFRRSDGRMFPVEVLCRPMMFDDRRLLYASARDISIRKDAERRLAESEERFRSLVEGTTDWVWETDDTHRFSWFSPSFARLFGQGALQVGQHRWSMADGREANLLEERWRRHLDDLEAHRPFRDFRYWLIDTQGRRHWISVSGSPRFDDKGRFLGYRGSGTDISEKAEMSTRLRLFWQTAEQSPLSVVIAGLDERITYANPFLCALSGYTHEELLGRAATSLGDDGGDGYAGMWAALRAGQSWSGEFCNRKKNGERYWLTTTIFPVTDDEGVTGYYVAIGEDATERKAAEARLLAQMRLTQRHYESLRALSDIASVQRPSVSEQLRAAVALACRHLRLPLGIISQIDGDSYIVRYHDAPQESDLSDGQVFQTGQTYCAITMGLGNVVAIPSMAESDHAGHPCYQAFHLETYIGAPVMVRGRPYGTVNFSSPESYGRDFDDGDIEFMRLLARWVGVTVERELTERELQAALRDTETARARIEKQSADLSRINAELEQFAYVASHDLRQPLRMVTSYLGLIEREIGDKLDGELPLYFNFAKDGAKRMDRLILDLLEYSRTGRNAADQPVSLADSVAEALLNLGPAIREAGATVTTSPGLPTIAGNAGELARLFQNLIGNAIKYCDPARPPVVEVGWKGEDGGWLLWVRDNGIGIAPADRDRVFQIFQRLVPREKYDGTGIGLAVARKIVGHHGGRIWIESNAGEGTTFFMAFPRLPAKAVDDDAA